MPRPLPSTPTDAKPGSAAKIRVLAERRALGLELHHPLDTPRVTESAEPQPVILRPLRVHLEHPHRLAEDGLAGFLFDDLRIVE